ncbi:MAG TPA: TIGR03435 family protein [Verrucomicrobiae bacterium]|nr:TIGR03435 family protein [Verrucomicrobiae bacterium]
MPSKSLRSKPLSPVRSRRVDASPGLGKAAAFRWPAELLPRTDLEDLLRGGSPPEDRDPAHAAQPMPAALQDQLGLKLTPAKGPVDVIVVDHAERPLGN